MQRKSTKPPGKAGGAPRMAPRQVRIIGGQWKRTPLPVLEAEGLRPTPDRVRETLFNWLNHLFDGYWENKACLDLFAGTGALGFEAASRGAARVLMVESFSPAARQLQATKDKLKAEQVAITRGDALATVSGLQTREAGQFHVIFLDPPYHQDWLPRMLPLCAGLLAPGGLVYAEAEFALDGDEAPDWMADWDVVRADKAGMVYFHLLQRKIPV
ncbi:MAG TPA: 16S rRNA (guanine(966)-N(2))-methyltransferase RsmD [Burkholderiaceae bacterium]